MNNKIDILLIYAKTDLPKNMGETQYIYQTIKNVYPNYWRIFDSAVC